MKNVLCKITVRRIGIRSHAARMVVLAINGSGHTQTLRAVCGMTIARSASSSTTTDQTLSCKSHPAELTYNEDAKHRDHLLNSTRVFSVIPNTQIMQHTYTFLMHK